MDCSKCKARAEQKPTMGCGWIPASERREFRRPSAWPEPVVGTCPGYLVQLPQVLETARLYAWRKDGALEQGLCGWPMTPLFRDCCDVLAGAIGEVEAHMLRRT